jgi:SAM-dependent methyltransferase
VSEPYQPDNLLDRRSDPATLQVHYDQEHRRERDLLDRRLGLKGGEVLSVGSGWHPGRHLFPRPAWRMTGVEINPAMLESEELDAGVEGRAGELPFGPGSFDVVLYRLVLHHVVFQGPLAPAFEEAARLLRPGGAMVAVEPGLWHPVGAALELANRAGLGTRVHGTPDDVPLSPRLLLSEARAAGLAPELHAVTFGSRPRLAPFGHTLLLIARRYSTSGIPKSGASAGSAKTVQPSRS